MLAAKTELKTIASRIIQHPAVTIERIKLRRRVIELSVQNFGAGPPPLLGKRRPLIARVRLDGLGGHRATAMTIQSRPRAAIEVAY